MAATYRGVTAYAAEFAQRLCLLQLSSSDLATVRPHLIENKRSAATIQMILRLGAQSIPGKPRQDILSPSLSGFWTAAADMVSRPPSQSPMNVL